MANENVTIHQVGSRDKSVDWYIKEDPNISESTREVFEKYSKISPERVQPHVLEIRDKAWEIFPYPCIGTYRFLDLSISQHPLYASLVSRLKQPGAVFLDLGTAFGQDIRRLVCDGVPSSHCNGADLRQSFMDLGYDLFLDRETLQTKLIEADVFADDADDAEGMGLKQLYGKVDVLQASAFFHLFDYDRQKAVAARVVKLLRPVAGSVLVGRQVGNLTAGAFTHRTNQDQTMYRHNVESWRQFWDEVGAETGTKWEVDGEMREIPREKGQAQASCLPVEGRQAWAEMRWIVFSVRRVE